MVNRYKGFVVHLESTEGMHVSLSDYSAIEAKYAELQRRFDAFVRSCGTTVYSCETCGRARTTKECIRCEHAELVKAVRDLCARATTLTPLNNDIDRLRKMTERTP